MNGKKKYKIDKLLLGSPEMGLPIQPFHSQDMVMGNPEAWSSMQNVFKQAPVAILVLSGNNYMVESANDFYLQIIEKDKDFIGKPLFDSLPELESQGIRQLMDTVMESGIPYNGNEMEVRLNRNDKKEQGFYNFIYQPIREQDNTITGIIVVVSEVTEQVLARKRVEESEEKFQLLVQQAPVAVCVLRGEDYVIEVINEPMYEMWDRTLEQVLNKPAFEVLTELKEQGFKELLDNVYHKGERFVADELPISLKRNGKLDNIFVKFVYEPLREADGTISGVMALAHDITQQVVARKKMEAQALMVENLLMTAPGFVCTLVGPTHIYGLVNKQYQQLFGSRQLQGKPLLEALPELVGQGFDTLLDNVYNTGEPFLGIEIPILLARDVNLEPELLYFNFSYQPMYDENKTIFSILVFGYEVTPQATFNQKIKQSESHFRHMTDLVPAKISNADADGNVTYFNKHWLDFTGLDFEDMKAFGYHKILHPDEIEEFQKRLQKAAETGTVLEMEMRFKNKAGDYVWHLNLASPVKDEHGNIKMWVGSTTEIQKIKESESYFRLMAELMPEKVTNAKPDGTIIYYNKSWQDYTGASFDELIREGWGKWIHPDEVAETTRLWLHSLKTGDDFDMELQMLNHEGEYRWHTSRARSVNDENGNTKLWIGFNSDIHDQKIQKEELQEAVGIRTDELLKANESLLQKNIELAEAKDKLLSEYSRSLIEASLDPLITLNTEGGITDMNEALATITGETREKLIGTDFSNYFTDPEKAREIYKEVFAKGFVTNYPLTIIDGELTEVLFNGSVYKDAKGNVLGAVVVARVITEMKRFEKELVEAKVFAELATLVAEEAQIKAEEAAKSKQQFLSNMSHEIRTPMNAIIGFTKVALKTDLTPKQTEYLNAIKTSGDTLIVLINDILDLAKVDAGKMAFEKTPFKMAASITAMLHLFETKIQEKNLEFIKEYDDRIPHVLEGDPVRLHQIIMNLVSNAVKFTSEGRITVSVRMLNENAENVTIEFAVADTGIGIEKDNLEKIFESFHQATTDTSRLFGGTGLGLNIAKQLVEKQGGSIHVKSKMTEGSTFSFILTFQKTNADAAFLPALMELDNDLKNIKVLVVEDMALNQLLMKTLLDDFGFGRDIANNGKIAIEKLTQKDEFGVRKAYDIILMDLQMPVMNGFEATAYIRNILHSKVPIIALTADVTTADLARCKAVGMDDYISKPVDEKLLYTKIVNLVKKPADIEAHHASENTPLKLIKYTDLGYLVQKTKNNPAMIAEMIEAFLEQTPPLVSSMKKSLLDKDWDTLHGAVHKMIPSFAIMGMSADFENMAKKIQDYARSEQQLGDIHDMVTQLENACINACKELEAEFKRIKSSEA